MRDALIDISIGLAVVAGVLAFIIWTKPTQPKPAPEITCAVLVADPDWFASQNDGRIRLRTDGLMPGTKPNEFICVRIADRPPVIVCVFASPVPDKLPPVISGVCIGKRGESVMVVDCR